MTRSCHIGWLIAFAGLGAVLTATGTRAENWPQWRGPQGLGLSQESQVPREWSATEHVKWRAKLPGPGNSSPIVWEDRVFVSCAENDGAVKSLLCFDRGTGGERWKRSVADAGKQLTHDTNPYCASSPVTDGRAVYVWQDSAGFFAYDLEGKELWRKDLGKFEHIWGTAASPVLYGDLVILSAGPGLKAFILAMNKRTGEEVWRVTPPGMVSEKVDEYRGSWSTPVLYDFEGRTQLILMLPERLAALDPTTGQEIWFSLGLGKLTYASALVSQDAIVAMSGFHGPALAVRPGGRGDVTETRRLWLQEDRKFLPQRVGSGVMVDGYVYVLNEPGHVWCLDARTGQQLWEETRLTGTSWCSLVHADGCLYATGERGETVVLEANPKACKIVARNPLNELTRASLAFSHGQIFQRTYENLYCFEP